MIPDACSARSRIPRTRRKILSVYTLPRFLEECGPRDMGKLDSHFTALWDNGHIKFWSPRTLGTLLSEVGFRMLSVERLGRVPALAMTMLVTAERTSSE